MNQILRSMSVMVDEFRRPVFSPRAVISPSAKYLAGEWQEAHETRSLAERRLSKKRSCPSEMVSANETSFIKAKNIEIKYFKHAPVLFGCSLESIFHFRLRCGGLTN
jgi:hypothetical protein